MPRRFYWLTRDLHLYCGLFLIPFVLVFSISTILLNHPSLAPAEQQPRTGRIISGIEIPEGLDRLTGMQQMQKVQPVLRQAGISGEILRIDYSPKTSKMVIPVMNPGRTTTLELDLRARTVEIRRADSGVLGAIIYLHKSPGPHLHAIRGNWIYTRVWRWFADGTACFLAFLIASGIYLWAVLRDERRIGLALLGTGFAFFVTLLYALAA
jgi:hypothetical protein